MEHFSIRPFKDKDIDFAYKLDTMERWNHTRNDIKRAFSFEPNGCFIAEISGKPVGHVFSVNYGRLGWIGFLIVETGYRGKGIGTLLMKRAIDHLSSCKTKTIKLEAVPIIANLYRKLGFVDEFDSLRFIRTDGKIAPMLSHCVKPLKKREMTQLAKFDSEYFGANRIRVLKGLYQDNPQLSFVSYSGPKIVGYIMCCKAESGYRLGPWVCIPRNPQVARELLIKCVEKIGLHEEIYVGVPALNKTATRILHDFDFMQYSKSIRMYLGKKLETERVDGIYAICGPEKG